MSEKESAITKNISQEPIERAIVEEPVERGIVPKRSELYAQWIRSHPILWGWLLFASLFTGICALFDYQSGYFFPSTSYSRPQHYPPPAGGPGDVLSKGGGIPSWAYFHHHPGYEGPLTIAVLTWLLSFAWAKRLCRKQWFAFMGALMVALAGALFGVLVTSPPLFSMASGPPPRSSVPPYFCVLLPLLGTLPGLCWAVAILWTKKRNQ